MIDLGRLQLPLQGVADDPRLGGTEGHVAIVPVNGLGQVDYPKLNDWAASRGTGRIHPFTQIVQDAIVREVKGKP